MHVCSMTLACWPDRQALRLSISGGRRLPWTRLQYGRQLGGHPVRRASTHCCSVDHVSVYPTAMLGYLPGEKISPWGTYLQRDMEQA